MACSHKDPPVIIEMAEAWLSGRGVTAERWSGMKIRHSENTPGGMWSSVVIEIERRGPDWVVTKIDRRNEAVPANEVGLSVL